MIDTHCHIDDPQYAEELDAFIAAQKAGGVECILVPGVDETSIHTVLEVCKHNPKYLYPALGLHPENVRKDWQIQLEQLHRAIAVCMASTQPLVAIGEVGLDYHFDTTYKYEQQEVLRRQMRWAEEWQLPVMIHSRDATEDCLSLLREFPTVEGVMHCFSGSRETAEQVLRMGYYLGIGGVLTFKNCKLADTLVSVPLERIVLETDSPYMAPVPHRGERNESRWMSFVVQRLAEVYHCSPEEVDKATTANAKRLFGVIQRCQEEANNLKK